METAKVFWSGRSQAVRLPKRFRVACKEVRIRVQGKALILEPVPDSWGWLDAVAGRLDQDFVDAVKEQPQPAERPDLDKLFRS